MTRNRPNSLDRVLNADPSCQLLLFSHQQLIGKDKTRVFFINFRRENNGK
jgi:hypothetical protein